MGKKRKSRGTSSGQATSSNAEYRENTRFNADETFADSEDEFLAGRDQIFLDEGPEAKRRRKIQEDGSCFRLRYLTGLFSLI